MKKRLLSFALAMTMLFGSVNVAFADETSVLDTDTVVTDEVVPAADDTASGGAVEDPSEPVESTGINWSVTSPWQATVYGDAGGQNKMDFYGNTSPTWTLEDGTVVDSEFDVINGETIFPYDVQDNGDGNIRMRMGVFNPDHTVLSSVGKIGGGQQDGRVYYYQKLTSDDDFTISATAHVNDIDNTNNQVSFGLIVTDDLKEAVNEKPSGINSISAGYLNMKKAADGKMFYGFTRINDTLLSADDETSKQFNSKLDKAPKIGDDINFTLAKAGNIYTITVVNGDVTDTTVYDGTNLKLSDDIYAGLYVSRAADITFSNVKLSLSGAEVEVGDWTSGGNGLVGNSDKIQYSVAKAENDNENISLSLNVAGEGSNGSALGKISNGEDSYGYYAAKAPANEDFTLSSTIDSIALATNYSGSNPAQAFVGVSIFDHTYKNSDNTKTGNQILIGLKASSNSSANADLIYKTVNGTDYETVTLKSGIMGVGTTLTGPIDFSVKRSGDTIYVTWGEDTYTINGVSKLFTNNQYIGYAVARDGSISVSNNKLSVGSRRVDSVTIESMPEKTQYYTSQSFDATGLSFRVNYSDGETVIVSDPSEYSLLGFDNLTNQSFNTRGEKTITATIGGANCNFTITVRDMKLLSLNVDYTPIYDTFYVGGKFDFTGLQVTAKYEDGSSVKLSSDAYELYIGDTLIVPGVTTITEDMVSPDVAITVKHVETEGIDSDNINGAFNVAIDPGKLTGLEVLSESFKTTFYIGDEYDQRGLVVSGIYTDANGNTSFQRISSDLYTVTGFDSSQVNENLELKIVYNEDPSIFTTYDIKVLTPSPLATEVEGYPRMTFNTGEAFDATGLVFGIFYSNDEVITLSEDVYYYKNGTEYYKIYNNNVEDENGNVIFTKDQKVNVNEAELNEADFYIDITNFNTSNTGTTQFVIYVNEKYGAAAMDPVEFTVSVVEATDYIWKGTAFGQSAMINDASSITATYKDGSTKVNTKNKYEIQPELMENGKLSNIESVRLNSWNGTGKVTNSMDGMAYYYTRIDGDNNFTVSADITVNRYIFDPDNLPEAQQVLYDQYIAEGDSPQVALDRLRSGQEAFGIAARDVIPLAGTMKDGVYTGDSNNVTSIAADALTKEYTFTKSDGSTVTYKAPVDAYEALENGVVVTEPDGTTHSYTYNDKRFDFNANSNAVFAGGMSDGTWPTDPSSSTYEKKQNINRINLVVRHDGSRMGYYATTTKVPEKNEKYNVTLTMMNTGYMITTYNYQDDTTSTQYFYDALEGTSNTLKTEDPNSIYVGFYAARYADITVSNIEFHETKTATDPNISGKVDEAVAPRITINSPYYTTNENYTLIMRSNATKGMVGGLTSVSLNGETVLSDITLGNKKSSFNVTLKPDYVNQFSVVYYPNTADNFTSYDPVITRFTVTHKSESKLNDLKKIYVAPNGSTSGDGTRNNPLTLEMALGIVDYGGQVIMLDGTYNLTNSYVGKISFDAGYSGYRNGNYKALVADEGANPVIDLEKEYEGFSIDADYWHFKGFSVINSKDNSNGFVLGGEHCVVENCTFVNNGDTGLQISRVSSDDKDITTWPSYNAIISCESYNNADPNGNNADGFAAKLTVGYGNVFEDCISHHNVDDGWDLYTKGETGAIGAVVLENCITYKNGFDLDEATGTETPYSKTEGNGFKMGGESIYVEHMLKDCVSFDNKGSGVNSNNNPAMIIRNVVSYSNEKANFNLASQSTEILYDSNGNTRDESNRTYKFNYDIKGAVSYGSTDSIGSWNADTGFGNVASNPIDSETNYLAKTGNIGVNSLGEAVDPAVFFKSVDENSSMTNHRYSRNADGSFNHGDFLARADEYAYEHDAADTVTLPDYLGGNGGVGLGVTTEATTNVTEATTSAPRRSSGAGGGGSVKNYVATTTTTEGTTSEVEEDTTEATTETVVFTDSVSVQVGSKDITINDSTYTMDVAPYIQTSSNSTMVPLRFVSIALAGGSVATADSSDIILWDAATKTATIAAGSNTIVFTAGSGTYTVNGSTLNISNQAVAEIVDGRMFVPFRTIGEALGAEVSWDANTKTAMYN